MRGALLLGALLSALTPCASALAHGEPPAAYAVISHDAEGARAVRLSHGVALRRAPKRFQFVCPSAWGDQYAAPVAALADGTIVVGATSGLMLLSEDGKVRMHPDPVAAGNTTDVVRSAQGVFSVRTTQAGSEVLAVDAQTARVVWKDTKRGYSLAALEDKLVLLRAMDLTLEQVTIATADGQELDRQEALVAAPVDYAFPRATAGSAYALVMFRTVSALGTLRMNAFSKIAEGQLSVAGPLSVGESTLLAPDGKLSQLVAGEARPLAADDNVLCLAQHDGLSYACNPEGIARVSAQALGEPLFQLSWLVGPDLELVAAGNPRERCNAQWQDLRVDLLMAGTSLLEDAMSDAGSALVDAAIVADAAIVTDAAIAQDSVEAAAAADADGGQLATADSRGKGSASCTALPWKGCSFAAYLYLALLVLVTRRTVSRRVRARCEADVDF